ncbi:proline-rich protein 18 [Cygnus atratus]|uniref:proline-rich protein 18 n=1 Tax=Cygnus atratus TaxID=8868 RepID=UPI0021B74A39|nr:proline-rich protein 18 [Cygnus atratus]
MGLQPRRAAGPCPRAGRAAALTGAAWARGEEPEAAPGRAASLPPARPGPAAAAASPVAVRAQPKKPPAASARKAAARPAEEKKARGAPPERAGAAAGSWPCPSGQRRPAAERERGARPQPQPQPQPRPVAAGPGGRPCEKSPGGAAALRLSLSLPPEAVRRHRYDDEEYEEDDEGAAAVDEGLVRKCTEWLRGVESAAGRDRGDRLDSLPHLGAL